MLLFYPAHHHAEMARFNDHADALWLDGFLNGLGNLRGQPFLDLQAAGEDFDQARNLAQADDFAVRNICDVNFAKKGSIWCSQRLNISTSFTITISS